MQNSGDGIALAGQRTARLVIVRESHAEAVEKARVWFQGTGPARLHGCPFGLRGSPSGDPHDLVVRSFAAWTPPADDELVRLCEADLPDASRQASPTIAVQRDWLECHPRL